MHLKTCQHESVQCLFITLAYFDDGCTTTRALKIKLLCEGVLRIPWLII